MVLHFSKYTKELEDLESRIKTLSLAYSKNQNEGLEIPMLKDGSKEYKGIDTMNDYIDLLDLEKEQWYYCNC